MTVVLAVFEAHVSFHVTFVFHRQSGVSNIVPVVQIVYLGEATFPNTRDTYATCKVGSTRAEGYINWELLNDD